MKRYQSECSYDYQARLLRNQQVLKEYLQGTMLWESSRLIQIGPNKYKKQIIKGTYFKNVHSEELEESRKTRDISLYI